MDRWSYRILDVFSNRPLAGNQLAVFEDAGDIPEHLLQVLAREIGFSETVYLTAGSDDSDAAMRIFTPASEVPFAGHPALGAAITCASRTGRTQIRLQTGRGVIVVFVEQGSGGAFRGSMHQPIPTVATAPNAEAILAAIGAPRSELPVMIYNNGVSHVFVVLNTPEQVAALRPDLQALTSLAGTLDAALVGFNVAAGSGDCWKTRMFAPAAGVPEDAATGSAAGPLALHLARHGLIDWGQEITIKQGAELGRPSELLASVALTENRVGPIIVSGQAHMVGGGWFDASLLRASATA
ncbi:MAG: PhzF family phenazine biosynthesis protein [Thermomicrobiales bacterium]|nr:PhzF family phenazine biosynthesis protein [Thermomicrobiales bacterium]